MSNTVFKNVKKLASEKNFTFQRLEHECGLGNGTIAKWEKCNPTIGNLEKVAAKLECKIADLFKEG